jgi:hypothetical protein
MALRRRTFGAEVASWEFRLQPRGGRKKRVRARVGKPYKISTREWACPVEIHGFEGRYADIRGVDSLQALCLATSLIRLRLEDVLSKGGRLLDVDDDSEWDLRAVRAAFGASASLSGAPHNQPLQQTALARRR